MFRRLLDRTRSAASSQRQQFPPPCPAAGDRIFAIGDIHGRADLLDGLLSRLQTVAAAAPADRSPMLLFLGDYIDRGDQSSTVLARIRAECDDPSTPWDTIVCLRGNHEAALLSFLEDPEKGAAWLGYGGRQTLASYGIALGPTTRDPQMLTDAADALRARMGPDLDLLQATLPQYRSGDVLFSHAGVDPHRPLDEQIEDALLWGRSSFLEEGAPQGIRVVHGHWDAADPIVTPGRICVDTGAFYTGILTAVQLDEDTTLHNVNVFDI